MSEDLKEIFQCCGFPKESGHSNECPTRKFMEAHQIVKEFNDNFNDQVIDDFRKIIIQSESFLDTVFDLHIPNLKTSYVDAISEGQKTMLIFLVDYRKRLEGIEVFTTDLVKDDIKQEEKIDFLFKTKEYVDDFRKSFIISCTEPTKQITEDFRLLMANMTALQGETSDFDDILLLARTISKKYDNFAESITDKILDLSTRLDKLSKEAFESSNNL